MPGCKRLGSLVELREYISIRRSYNLVRQETPSSQRLTFEEFAILCKLEAEMSPLKTSQIASYQGSLRPTMTHRTNHLACLGFIDRHEGAVDSRNVECTISSAGRECVDSLLRQTCDHIATGQPLSRTSPERLAMYVEAMGTVFCKAGDLVLLSLRMSDNGATISGIVNMLGLLQPTVSMSVSSLEEVGLVERASVDQGSSKVLLISLTNNGAKLADGVAGSIHDIVVRRKPRSNA